MYSNPTTEDGIVENTRKRVGADEDAYPIKELTANANKYYRQAVEMIQKVDRTWKWDDTNATDLPIEEADIVSGQPDYPLDSDVRYTERVEYKAADGSYKPLRRLDATNIAGSLEEMFRENDDPIYYDLVGQSLYLYPTPSESRVNGLKMWNRRGFVPFVSTDTTKEPGFDYLYHDFIVEGAAYEYAKVYKTEVANSCKDDMLRIGRAMVEYYKRRGGAPRVKARRVNAR